MLHLHDCHISGSTCCACLRYGHKTDDNIAAAQYHGSPRLLLQVTDMQWCLTALTDHMGRDDLRLLASLLKLSFSVCTENSLPLKGCSQKRATRDFSPAGARKAKHSHLSMHAHACCVHPWGPPSMHNHPRSSHSCLKKLYPMQDMQCVKKHGSTYQAVSYWIVLQTSRLVRQVQTS